MATSTLLLLALVLKAALGLSFIVMLRRRRRRLVRDNAAASTVQAGALDAKWFSEPRRT
jgi:hypothetical protein